MANDKSRYRAYDWVAIHRSDKTAEEVGNGRVMARDEEHAKIQAAFKLDSELQDKIDEVEITVRPF